VTHCFSDRTMTLSKRFMSEDRFKCYAEGEPIHNPDLDLPEHLSLSDDQKQRQSGSCVDCHRTIETPASPDCTLTKTPPAPARSACTRPRRAAAAGADCVPAAPRCRPPGRAACRPAAPRGRPRRRCRSTLRMCHESMPPGDAMCSQRALLCCSHAPGILRHALALPSVEHNPA